MPLQAQDGDKAVTFATLAFVRGSVVSTKILSPYLQKIFDSDCADGFLGCRGWSVPHLD
jgi:hypothetical protein